MKKLKENSVDAVVTDPPYGLKFMGKEFDDLGEGAQQREWHRRWAEEALRVLKPGGHLLAFGGTRTYHHLATAVEDAGFEIRDQMQWLYGSGFPKSLNVGKAIDKKKGKKRKVVGKKSGFGNGGLLTRRTSSFTPGDFNLTAPATEEAARWEGWGTALKPANEPIVVARKPFKGTVAENVLEHGTGAINVDGCRVGSEGGTKRATNPKNLGRKEPGDFTRGNFGVADIQEGRWPANVILDEEAGQLLDQEAKEGPSRFFYCPKAAKKERNAGLEEFEEKRPDKRTTTGMGTFEEKGVQPQSNHHPTVKPVALMAYLIRLVTPPGGTVLDPFLGSGSTGIAAIKEPAVARFIGIEQDPEYIKIARARIAHYKLSEKPAKE